MSAISFDFNEIHGMKNARLPTPFTTADHGRRHSCRCRPFSIIQFWITKGTKINLSAVIRCFSSPPLPAPPLPLYVSSLSLFSFMLHTKPMANLVFVLLLLKTVGSGEKHFENHTHTVCGNVMAGPDAIIFSLYFFVFVIVFIVLLYVRS